MKRIGLGLVALILVFSIVSMIFVKNFYDGNFPRFEAPKNSGYLRYIDVSEAYPRTEIQFQSGENTLVGYLYGTANQKGLVVIAPGSGEGADTFLPETLYFVDHGWQVFAINYTGSYASQGQNSRGLPQSKIDLEAALNYVANDAALRSLPLMLYGHSWGAYAVTAVLKDGFDVAAVASISGFNSPDGLMAEQSHKMLGVFSYLEYPYEWLYQSLLFGPAAHATAVDAINSSDTPVMVIHGTADEYIEYGGASIIAQRDQITNPNVVYKTCDTENQNGHNNLYKPLAAQAYIAQKNQEFQALKEQYNGNVPDAALNAFYAGIDRYKTSQRDADFMNAINQFFEAALP